MLPFFFSISFSSKGHVPRGQWEKYTILFLLGLVLVFLYCNWKVRSFFWLPKWKVLKFDRGTSLQRNISDGDKVGFLCTLTANVYHWDSLSSEMFLFLHLQIWDSPYHFWSWKKVECLNYPPLKTGHTIIYLHCDISPQRSLYNQAWRCINREWYQRASARLWGGHAGNCEGMSCQLVAWKVWNNSGLMALVMFYASSWIPSPWLNILEPFLVKTLKIYKL